MREGSRGVTFELLMGEMSVVGGVVGLVGLVRKRSRVGESLNCHGDK